VVLEKVFINKAPIILFLRPIRSLEGLKILVKRCFFNEISFEHQEFQKQNPILSFLS